MGTCGEVVGVVGMMPACSGRRPRNQRRRYLATHTQVGLRKRGVPAQPCPHMDVLMLVQCLRPDLMLQMHVLLLVAVDCS